MDENLLGSELTDDELVYYCEHCGKKYISTPEDAYVMDPENGFRVYLCSTCVGK